MKYEPGDVVRIGHVLLVGGVALSGESLTVDIYDTATGTALVSGAAMTEISTYGAYYYDYTSPGSAGRYHAIIWRSASRVEELEFETTTDPVGEYAPSDTVKAVKGVFSGGVAQTGLAITADVFDLVLHTRVVSGGSASELGSSGVYSYSYATAATAKTYLVVLKNGTSIIHQQSVNTIASAVSSDLTARYTTIDNMETRVNNTFAAMSLYDTTSGEVVLRINQAIEKILRSNKLLHDKFPYNISQGVTVTEITASNPSPYEVDLFEYTGSGGYKQLGLSDKATVNADIAAGVTEAYRYSMWTEGARRYIEVNFAETSNYPSGIVLHGPYFPAYVATGSSSLLPLEKRYDMAIEAMVISDLVNEWSNDTALQGSIKTWADTEMQRAGLNNATEN